MMRFPICLQCRHLDRTRKGHFCAAFPAGIPEPIVMCEVQHTRPYPGDHGIHFEPSPDPFPPQPASPAADGAEADIFADLYE